MRLSLFTGVLLLLPPLAGATEFSAELYLDARYAIASGEPSWLDQGLGKGRYGGGRSGGSRSNFDLAEVAFIGHWQPTWDLKGFLHLKHDPEQNNSPDVVEAYFSYQAVPRSAFSYRLKAGLFFPEISRENTAVAWTSPYTISSSAINTWVGEEIRTTGLELKVTHRSDYGELSLTGSAFAFNDPAGTLLAFRGWSIGDVKVGARGDLPLAQLPAIGPQSSFVPQVFEVKPVREVDEKLGYYAAIDWRDRRALQVGALYYDNRADPEDLEASQYGWGTRFVNFYVELDLGDDITAISQYMRGTTNMGGRVANGNRRQIDVDYAAGFVLASKKMGRYRASARFDWFEVVDNSNVAIDNNNEEGEAYTLAISMKVRKQDLIMMEFLYIDSERAARRSIGYGAQQDNKLFQLSYRFRL